MLPPKIAEDPSDDAQTRNEGIPGDAGRAQWIASPIYHFVPGNLPVVNYQGLMPIHDRRTGLVGHGMTYGEHLRAAWMEQRSKRGLVVLEKDIAMSLEGWTRLAHSIDWAPDFVWAVPYLLYPASTGMDLAVWAHRVFGPAEKLLFCGAHEKCPPRPDAFGLGCTFLPERLLRAMAEDLRQWDYPMLDSRLSELAREIGVGCRTTSIPAIHLHY